jgi:cytidylate kinase
MSLSSDRVVEALARLQRYADIRPDSKQAATPPGLTIAMSRQAGSGGAEIARAVGAALGWPVYDNELLTRIAEEKGLHAKLLERLDERPVAWLEELVQNFSAAPSPTESSYVKGLLELLATLGKVGHCVIVGRAAVQVLPAEATLRVRVVAPLQVRIATVEKTQNMTHQQASRWVEQTDRERARFVQHHFRANVEDPLGYDLIINSARFSRVEAAALIVQAARALEPRHELHQETGQERTFQIASA